MLCEKCNKQVVQRENSICGVCATFNDDSYDRKYALSTQNSKANSWDDLNAEIEFKWRELARESRERIAEKYPSNMSSRVLT